MVKAKKKIDRKTEYEESERAITEKAKKLVKWMQSSKVTLVYTGAGISTAAKIPDYRGPNGVWTLAQQGKDIVKCADIIETEPTVSHMVLKELHRQKHVKHILSQNCDGLHLRSGLPQTSLSEIHGNMHIEVCTNCPNTRQYFRSYDVTERSQFRKHGTGRNCDNCSTELVDTIVHFGEVGKVPWPLNWKGTTSLVENADLILCVGTSLAVLKEYGFLWPEKGSKTKLVIVNLQWTPKDRQADMKINAKCDRFLLKVADLLNLEVKAYCRDCDPIINPKRNARSTEMMKTMTDCTCHIRPPRIVIPEVLAESAPDKDKMPGWWAAGIRTQKKEQVATKPVKKRGRPRKAAKKETDVQVVRSIVQSLVDTIDPPPKRSRGRPKKEEVVVVESDTESESEEPEEDEEESADESEEEEIIEKPSCSRARNPTFEELVCELGADSDESSDADSDPEFKVTKQQLSARASMPCWLSTRRRSTTESEPLMELPMINRRGLKRKIPASRATPKYTKKVQISFETVAGSYEDASDAGSVSVETSQPINNTDQLAEVKTESTTTDVLVDDRIENNMVVLKSESFDVKKEEVADNLSTSTSTEGLSDTQTESPISESMMKKEFSPADPPLASVSSILTVETQKRPATLELTCKASPNPSNGVGLPFPEVKDSFVISAPLCQSQPEPLPAPPVVLPPKPPAPVRREPRLFTVSMLMGETLPTPTIPAEERLRQKAIAEANQRNSPVTPEGVVYHIGAKILRIETSSEKGSLPSVTSTANGCGSTSQVHIPINTDQDRQSTGREESADKMEQPRNGFHPSPFAHSFRAVDDSIQLTDSMRPLQETVPNAEVKRLMISPKSQKDIPSEENLPQ